MQFILTTVIRERLEENIDKVRKENMNQTANARCAFIGNINPIALVTIVGAIMKNNESKKNYLESLSFFPWQSCGVARFTYKDVLVLFKNRPSNPNLL